MRGCIKPGEFRSFVGRLGVLARFRGGQPGARRRLVYHQAASGCCCLSPDSSRQASKVEEQVRWIAAKLMEAAGVAVRRWSSSLMATIGVPNPQRNADFNYAAMDARGLLVQSVRTHPTQVNPRDTQPEIERTRHHSVRRGLLTVRRCQRNLMMVRTAVIPVCWLTRALARQFNLCSGFGSTIKSSTVWRMIVNRQRQ